MKVALIILRAESARGGAERYTRDLAVRLVERGVDVLTLASTFDGDWPGQKQLIPVTALSRAGQYKQFLASIDTAFTAEPDRLFHAMLPIRRAHLYHPHAGIAAVPKRSLLLEPFNRRRLLMSRVERDLLTGPIPPLTLALSNYNLGHLRKHYRDVPAQVLLNGVDLARFDRSQASSPEQTRLRQSWGTSAHDTVALCIAQDFRRKGVPVAIEALASTPQVDKLVVIGRDDPRPMLALARKLNVAERVVFPGAMSDPRPAYAAASFFLLPTSHDPCPLVIIEALAMGLPVISTVFNGATEWMCEPAHGHILPDAAASTFVQALRSLDWDNQWYFNCRNALEVLRPRLSIDRHVEQLLTTYQAVAKRLSP